MSNRTALYVRKQPGGMFTIENVPEHPGNIWFVGSDVTTASDTAGYGRNPDAPFATLDYAIGQCTANNGDTIYVLPSHSETKSATGAQVTLDVAGVKIVGLGDGSDRPTFTFSHTGATWTWTAANVTIENLLFVTGTDSVVTFASISGNDAKIVNCEARDAEDVEVITDFTCTGDRLVVDGLFKNGYTGGNANVRVLSLDGVDRAEIKNCRFITKVTTAVVGFVSHACTAIEIHDCDFLVTSTTNYTKNVVDTITGSTWSCWNVFDLGAGASFSGGSGATLAGDDVAAATTYASQAVSLATLASTSLSTATVADSAQTSFLTKASTTLSTATAADSAQTSFLTDASTTLSTALIADSTQTSFLTDASTALSTALIADSTQTSFLTDASTALSTALIADSAQTSFLTKASETLSTAAAADSTQTSFLTDASTAHSTALIADSAQTSFLTIIDSKWTSYATYFANEMSSLHSEIAST